MISEPTSEVVVTRCQTFNAGIVQNERITAIANRIAQFAGTDSLPSCRVEVIHLAPQHNGLGSGTQLSLAVAEAIVRVTGLDVTSDQFWRYR